MISGRTLSRPRVFLASRRILAFRAPYSRKSIISRSFDLIDRVKLDICDRHRFILVILTSVWSSCIWINSWPTGWAYITYWWNLVELRSQRLVLISRYVPQFHADFIFTKAPRRYEGSRALWCKISRRFVSICRRKCWNIHWPMRQFAFRRCSGTWIEFETDGFDLNPASVLFEIVSLCACGMCCFDDGTVSTLGDLVSYTQS